MKAIAPVCFVALTACAGGQGASPANPSWEPFYGTYEFSGTVHGQTQTSVLGTFRLGEGRWYLDTSHGACDGQLSLVPSNRLRMGCPGIGLEILRLGDSFETNGTARISVREQVQRRRCIIGSDGKQVCTTRWEAVDVGREARVVVRHVGEGG